MKSEVLRVGRTVMSAMLDVIMPPFDPSQSGENIWGDVKFLDEPCCACCGFPFDYAVGEGALCAPCLIKKPPYESARAAMVYDDASRPLILSFKHGGKTENLSRFAAQLSRVGREFLVDADYIVPVPLHSTRRIHRRYNQSVLLARSLSKMTNVSFDPDILYRQKATPSQGGKTAAGRRRNVLGAFNIREASKDRLCGKHIIVIDDVMTTGATVEACASILLRSGAKRVDVLCLARVIKENRLKQDKPYGQS